jgi:hypothetical protein
MTDFRNPRNNGRSLPPSFGGSISGEGSSGQKGKAVDLSAEVSGRTKPGITGRVNVAEAVRKISTELPAEVR